MLLVLRFEEMLVGVGYESIPKGFEDGKVRGLATPEVLFFACLNRDCAVSRFIAWGVGGGVTPLSLTC